MNRNPIGLTATLAHLNQRNAPCRHPELTHAQRERIDKHTAYIQARQRREYRQGKSVPGPMSDATKVLLLFIGTIALLSLVTGLAMGLGWEPGHQHEIAAEYRANRHEAVLVVER